MADGKFVKDKVRENLSLSVAADRTGLVFHRVFTAAGQDPLESVVWQKRSAVIRNEKGEIVFEQHDVEAPSFWSDMALTVVVSRYFRGTPGTPERESSVRDMLRRVVDTIAQWGVEQGYFSSEEDSEAFREELMFLVLHQKASFNSPVWFNVGVDPVPQCSACFIISVEDTMESILHWYTQEGRIFKGGSGSGINVSKLRSAREALSGGGTASGPLSFMKAADASAGVIKSGGKTRRAAKMVVLNVDHPDILDFIRSKALEEKKVQALVNAGYDGSLDGEAYSTVAFQNSNHSVRLTDDFMKAVEKNENWQTRLVVTGEIADTYRATDLLEEIARAAHACGDPGLQFDTTINRWHTCPETAPIRSSNPCSEYMHVDDSACNLASLKVTAFMEDGSFRTDTFRHAVDVMITAQDIIVDKASYPTPAIARNSMSMRALGLGVADLGAFIMSMGLPYDSDTGRNWAAAISAIMAGEAYTQSARLASVRRP
ncbi:MAG: vitamin B12-dependent ribonucleotide reductase, partial [Desulfomonile tiedjei]|nr:vitamin B12-dependent ribonucleotide reductase [Desulfomonile tiedjei]